MSLQEALIAFDLDGTLVDTAPDLIGALNAVLTAEGLPPVPMSSARHLVGHGVRALLERGFAEAGRPLDPESATRLMDRFIDIYLGRIAQESVPFEGVEPALDRLAAAGATLVVCTNKRTELSLALLDALKLTPRFAAVVGPENGVQKPDPRLLWWAIERGGGHLERSLFVGDSLVDLATAKAAKAPIIGVSFGYVEAPLPVADFDAVIDHFDELPAAVERLIGAGA